MWRSSKESVASELGIPRQVSLVERLDLSAVERHAYQRRHKETAASALQLLPEDVVRLFKALKAVPTHLDRPLSNKEAASLFPRLLHLRQVMPLVHNALKWDGSRCFKLSLTGRVSPLFLGGIESHCERCP
jgi:hypothetical protein